MKFFTEVNEHKLCETLENGGCGQCQSSCQSACKTSCTVGNQGCDSYLSIEDVTTKNEEVFVTGLL